MYLKIGTREAEEYYPKTMANSIHFWYSEDKNNWEALNQNYGILFAKAIIRDNNTIEERCLIAPAFIKTEKGYGIIAECVDANDAIVEQGKVLLWLTDDFINFEEKGLVERRLVASEIEIPVEIIELSEELGNRIITKWTPISSVAVELPKSITIKNWEELEQIKATVVYSEGSIDRKRISWDLQSVEKMAEAKWLVRGHILAPRYEFPLASGYADPMIFQWENSWYYVATNDNKNAIGIYVRKAESIQKLFDADTEEHCILDYDEERNLIQTFWAPEFHVIGENVYLLFAVSGKEFNPQSHIMKLKKDGNILCKEDWEAPVRVIKKDGAYLAEKGITLDMTYFQVGSKAYFVWSYRYGIGTKEDTGSMLYIAEINEKEPWKLISDPVLLSRPLYAWENHSGTINNEGPFALISGDKIYLFYSGRAAGGYSYVVAYLSANIHDDLLNPDSWEKVKTPLLSYCSQDRIYGPGHNSFYVDEEGKIWVAYHAQASPKGGARCTAINRVQLDNEGVPILNLPAERDLAGQLREVMIEVNMMD